MGCRYIVVGKHDDDDNVDDVDRDICSQVLIGTFRMSLYSISWSSIAAMILIHLDSVLHTS